MFYFCRVDSPVGKLAVVVSAAGLFAIEFDGDRFAADSAAGAIRPKKAVFVEDDSRTERCVEELQAYFGGALREFTIPLDLRGTEFQKLCWQALLQIPYGTTRSYAHIAHEVGRPTAFRAVGMANHSNPIPIVVPCHRVLASNGTLCGYGGGLDVKEKLLRLEGVLL